MQHGPLELLDRSGHGIHRIHGAQDHRPIVRAGIVVHTHRLEVGNHRKVLPNLLIQTGQLELLAQDGIGLTQRLQTIARDGTQAAHTQTRTREGLTINHIVRQTQLYTTGTHLILEELTQRLHEGKLQILRQTAHVVVRLNHLGRLRTALHDVGIDRTLTQEVDTVQLAGLLLKDADKLATDDLALLLGILHALELREEALRSIDIDQVGVELVAEYLNHILRLALAHQTVVYVYADELVANGLQEQRSQHRRIDTAREGQQHLLIAHLTTHKLHLVVDEVLHVPVRLGLANIKYERLNSLLGCLHIVTQLRHLHLAQGLIVTHGDHRETGLINLGQDVDLHAVYHIHRATIQDHTLHTGQRLQLLGRNVVRIDLTIHTQSTDSSGQHRIFVAAQIQNHNHILFHNGKCYLLFVKLINLKASAHIATLFQSIVVWAEVLFILSDKLVYRSLE